MLIFCRTQASNSIMLRPKAPSPYMMMTSLRGERLPLLPLERAQLTEPAARQLGRPARGAGAGGERLHHQARVADDADVTAAVLAQLAPVQVDVDQPGRLVDVRAAAVAQAEVEGRSENEDHVGAHEGILAG